MGGALTNFIFVPPLRGQEELAFLQSMSEYIEIQIGDDEPPVTALHFERGAKMTVLYSHANAEDLLDVCDTLVQLTENVPVNAIGYDYPGYGLTPGIPDEMGCYRAARACLLYLYHKGVKPSTVVLMGRSLGSGPTVDLATKEFGIAGIVLQSGILSILSCRLPPHVASRLGGADLFNNFKKISSVKCPVFMIHGQNDEVVPLAAGRELWQRAPNALAPWWVEDANHNDVHLHRDYFSKLEGFLQVARACSSSCGKLPEDSWEAVGQVAETIRTRHKIGPPNRLHSLWDGPGLPKKMHEHRQSQDGSMHCSSA